MPRNSQAKPTFYDGQWFPSLRKAAEYAKVDDGTIKRRITKGIEHKDIKKKLNAKPIETPFGVFSAINQIEKQLGIPKSNVRRRLMRGEPGYKYL